MKKLAIVSTHPIQYNAPWFALLAASPKIDLKVFYTWSQASETVKDRNFGREIQWDIPLLEGYAYEFVENVSNQPGSHHYKGIDNPKLIPAIKTFSPDAILVFGWNFKSHLKVLRYFKGKVPLWFRGDSTLLDEVPGLKTLLRRQVLRWVYSHIDKAFYVGSANKAYFLKHGLKEYQLIFTPHAIDNERFADDELKNYRKQAMARREALGIDAKDLVLLFAGKFETKKQPDFLITAVIEANKQRQSPVKLVLVGQGPLETQLKAVAKPYDFIYFLPFQNQSKMPVVYRLGDVFCLPSRGPGETWGLAVNEAMASGRPAMVSDKVGCAKDLLQKDNGWVFEHNNFEELKQLLIDLDKDALPEMGVASIKLIRDWHYKNIVKAITEVI